MSIELEALGFKISSYYDERDSMFPTILQQLKGTEKEVCKFVTQTVLDDLVQNLTVPAFSKIINLTYEAGKKEGKDDLRETIKALMREVMGG